MSLATVLRLWWARATRAGLRRECKRLHQLRGGIDWELARNKRDTDRMQVAIACLEEHRRVERFARRYAVRGGHPPPAQMDSEPSRPPVAP